MEVQGFATLSAYENFLYALKAKETKRQYPKRLKMMLEFLGLKEPLENQAFEFLQKARVDSKWSYDNFIRFISYQKQRVLEGEIAESTISNYYKAAKLFCEMNDLTLNWKRLHEVYRRGDTLRMTGRQVWKNFANL